MKFAYFHIYNHQVFGDLKISFLNEEGNPYDTIILAGENGAGKSTLLNLLYKCSSIQFDNSMRDERREYMFILSEKEQAAAKESFSQNFQGIPFEADKIKIEINSSLKDWAQIQTTFISNKGDIFEVQPHEVRNRMGSFFMSIFSDVAINFNSREISSVTAQEIDIGVETNKKSDETLGTDITQLLIDISSSDASDLQSWVISNPGKIPPNEIVSQRMERFTRAFESMFPAKKFDKIENVNGRKSVNFIEHGKTIALSEFSSGEKQIVFRGSFLLRDRNRKEGAIIYIDEPEISLHPRWQLKILNFYQDLFSSNQGKQQSQIFVATHSPFIIHNDNRLNDKVLILDKNTQGEVSITDSQAEFFSWSQEKIIKDAFKIDLKGKLSRNTVLVEGELDEAYFTKCIELYKRNDITFDVKWVGRTKENGNNEFSGDTALNTMKTVCLAHPNLISYNIILYFDNDCNKPDEDYKNVSIRSAPKTVENKIFSKGIESLLVLPPDFDKSQFLKEKITDDGNGGEIIKKAINKRDFCTWVTSHSSAKSILSKLNEILNELQKVWPINT